MKIVVNDIAASEGGALSVLLDFYNTVKEYDHENEYVFLLSAPYLEETDRISVILLPTVKKSRFEKIKFDLLCGKKLINELQPDVVFSLQNIITFGVKCPQVTYVHQSIPYQTDKKFSFFKKEERRYAIIQYGIGAFIDLSIKKADKVIVQTNWMKEAIIKKCKIPDNKINVNYYTNKKNIFMLGTNDRKFNQKKFFYPTSDFVYKNNKVIFEASNILCGKGIRDFDVELTIPANTSNQCSNVKCIGRISREKVFEKYMASTLLFPSVVESSSLPLTEAKQVGSIILAADCLYAREVLSGYENAYFFDFSKPEELALLMEQVINGVIEKKVIKDDWDDNNTWIDVINLLKEL